MRFYIGNPRIWNFTITSAGAAAGLSAISGNFAIKDTNSIADPIVFTLYNGFNGTGSSLASYSLSANTTTSGAFASYLMPITPTSSLSAGGYSLMLSSNTASGGSTQYFVKDGGGGGTVSLTNADGSALDSSYFSNGIGPTPTPTATPTPAPLRPQILARRRFPSPGRWRLLSCWELVSGLIGFSSAGNNARRLDGSLGWDFEKPQSHSVG